MSEYFFLLRPYRCFTCNRRFRTLHAYWKRLTELVNAHPEHPLTDVVRDHLLGSQRPVAAPHTPKPIAPLTGRARALVLRVEAYAVRKAWL